MVTRRTPDAHDFPTRPYDLVKEFGIALVVVTLLSVGLAAIFSSPDEKAITMRDWAAAAPNDVVATATGELAGTTTSAGYGPPFQCSIRLWSGVKPWRTPHRTAWVRLDTPILR